MSTLAKIENTFPNGHRLPRDIAALGDFLDQNGYPISGCFELSLIGMDDLQHWFKRDPSVAENFLPFGRGATGDVFAIWLQYGRPTEECPVVMFGSEGLLIAVSNCARDFIRLLCLGYSEIGYCDLTIKGEDYDETKTLRHYVADLFGYDIPENGQEILAAASYYSAAFEAFVRENAWGELP
jgi:hypothetical protein